METEANTIQVLGSAAIAAVTAFVIVYVTGWGINSGWSIFLLAFVIFVALSLISGYIRGRSTA